MVLNDFIEGYVRNVTERNKHIAFFFFLPRSAFVERVARNVKERMKSNENHGGT